jgi:hypothetical protein
MEAAAFEMGWQAAFAQAAINNQSGHDPGASSFAV